jgi:hypothetical protein
VYALQSKRDSGIQLIMVLWHYRCTKINRKEIKLIVNVTEIAIRLMYNIQQLEHPETNQLTAAMQSTEAPIQHLTKQSNKAEGRGSASIVIHRERWVFGSRLHYGNALFTMMCARMSSPI